MLLRCEPVVGSMEEAEATWLVQLTEDPKQMLQHFLDMSKERRTSRSACVSNKMAMCKLRVCVPFGGISRSTGEFNTLLVHVYD